jgi:hypothetical protein
MLRRTTHLAFATALVAATAAFAPAAHADRIGFNVSIGGPGYGVTFGNAPYFGHRHYYRPAPVYVAPRVVYAAPRVVYRAPPVVYVAPPTRIVYRAPYRHRVIVRGPRYYRY